MIWKDTTKQMCSLVRHIHRINKGTCLCAAFFRCIYCWQMKAGMWQFIPFCYFHMHVIVTDDNVSSCVLRTLQRCHTRRQGRIKASIGIRVAAREGGLPLKPYWRNQGPKKKKQTNPKLWCRVNERGFWPVSAQLETLSAGPAAVTKALTQLQTAAPINLKMSKQFGDSEGLKSMLGWKEGACAHMSGERIVSLANNAVILIPFKHYNQSTSCQWRCTALHWMQTLSNTPFQPPEPKTLSPPERCHDVRSSTGAVISIQSKSSIAWPLAEFPSSAPLDRE